MEYATSGESSPLTIRMTPRTKSFNSRWTSTSQKWRKILASSQMSTQTSFSRKSKRLNKKTKQKTSRSPTSISTTRSGDWSIQSLRSSLLSHLSQLKEWKTSVLSRKSKKHQNQLQELMRRRLKFRLRFWTQVMKIIKTMLDGFVLNLLENLGLPRYSTTSGSTWKISYRTATPSSVTRMHKYTSELSYEPLWS